MNIDGTIYPIKLVNFNEKQLNTIKEALRDSGQEFEVQNDISNNSSEIKSVGYCGNSLFDINVVFDFSFEDTIHIKANNLFLKPFEVNIHCKKNELLNCLRLFVIQWGQGDWGGTNICDLKYINGDCYFFNISAEYHEELIKESEVVLNYLISKNRKPSYFLFGFISSWAKFKEMVEFQKRLENVLLENGYDINEIEVIVCNFQVDVQNVECEIPIFVKFEDDLSYEERRKILEAKGIKEKMRIEIQDEMRIVRFEQDSTSAE